MGLFCAYVAGANGAADADLSLGAVAGGGDPVKLGEDSKRRAEALAHYSAALQAEDAGDARAALKHYRELFRRDPSQAEIVRKTASLAERYGEDGEAEALLQAAIDANPLHPAPLLRMIEFLDAYRQDEASMQRADEAMVAAVRRFPADGEVRAAAALRFLARDERAKAEKVLSEGLGQPVKRSDYWMMLARAAQEVWPLGDPGLSEAHRGKVNAFFEKALGHARAEGDSGTELQVAQFFLLSNQLKEAREVCERMVDEDVGLTVRKILYRLYEAMDEPDKALETLRGIVADDPSDVAQQRLLASVLEEKRDYEGAARHLEQAVQVGGGTVEDYEKLGNLWLGLGQPDRALSLMDRATRLFPELPGFHAQRAMAYTAKEDLARAVESFARADELSETVGAQSFNHRFYFRYGVTLERAGRHEEAAEQLQRAITRTPAEEAGEAANTMNYLGYMWLELGRNVDKGGELIEKANELEPNNPAYIDSLGWFQFKKGRLEEALKTLKRAEQILEELQPEDAEIIEHIGLVEEALGERDQAIETLERAKALQTPDRAVEERIQRALDRLNGKPAGTGKESQTE